MWFSHILAGKKAEAAIGSAKCIMGFEFEIKTDNSLGLCTLPGSSHKKNPEFHYLAVGIMDGILVSDVLYDLFVEMFKDCLLSVSKNSHIDDDNNNNYDDANGADDADSDKTFDSNSNYNDASTAIVAATAISATATDNTQKEKGKRVENQRISSHYLIR